jgi:hypothetical protein
MYRTTVALQFSSVRCLRLLPGISIDMSARVMCRWTMAAMANRRQCIDVSNRKHRLNETVTLA